jgi:tetratricopeptide (TPR) repeat protein
VDAAHAGRKAEAREIFMQVVEVDSRNEMAWMWLSGLMDDLEDQIIACENVLTINPENHKIQLYLDDLRQRKTTRHEKAMEAIQRHEVVQPDHRKAVTRTQPRDPLRMAQYLEQDGKFHQALEIYRVEAAKAKNAQVFDQIFKRIIRIEKVLDEKIKYIPPRTSITRLAFPWPLLYVSLALVQVGLRPAQHLASYVWLAFPWVVLGSFLVAVAEIRSRHVVWRKLFRERGDGSVFARSVVGVFGWIMILVPFGLILLDSLNRLAVFQIPPRPY